jgi:hypothetical protein
VFLIVSTIAASGHIAFATSFEPCANDKRATAKIKGTLKRLFTNFFLSLKYESFLLLYLTFKNIYDITPIIIQVIKEFVGLAKLAKSSFEFDIGFNHFVNKYIENIVTIIQT